jgi:hypothetical protein
MLNGFPFKIKESSHIFHRHEILLILFKCLNDAIMFMLDFVVYFLVGIQFGIPTTCKLLSLSFSIIM